MHAYLITGNNKSKIDEEIEKICQKQELEKLEFPLEKIGEVRELISFTKLHFNKKTAFIIRNFDKATLETGHAFLKSLEESASNLYYILTASSIYQVLPTVVSRCQIIKTEGAKIIAEEDAAKINLFLESPLSEKFKLIESFTDRGEALSFLENLIIFCHRLLHGEKNLQYLTKIIKNSQKTHNNLKANGNLKLQLTNFLIHVGS